MLPVLAFSSLLFFINRHRWSVVASLPSGDESEFKFAIVRAAEKPNKFEWEAGLNRKLTAPDEPKVEFIAASSEFGERTFIQVNLLPCRLPC